MPITLTNDVNFNDSTVQSTAALPLTGGTLSGPLVASNLLNRNFVNRGTTTTTALLSDFNTVHYYQGPNTAVYIDLPTQMVENAIYKVVYTSNGSGTNYDPVIYPNGTTYSGAFYWNFYHVNPSGGARARATDSAFYQDHYGGSTGTDACGEWTIFNVRNYKRVYYFGGDTAGVSNGMAVWRDSTTQWLTVGQLRAANSFYKAWVYRVA